MELALGTVQFGLVYGIAGTGLAVPEGEVRAILEDAADAGVRLLDTAVAYGDIEQRLARLAAGLPFSVVSKVPPIPAELEPAAAGEFALASAILSRERLGPMLRGLMLHRSEDLEGSRGDAVWGRLSRWAEAEHIVLGASCYSPDEAAGLVASRHIAVTQLPGNAFDQRLAGPVAPGLAGLEIHLRSAFLQGLLLLPESTAKMRLPQAAAALAAWHKACGRWGMKPLEAALSVVKSFESVDAVVVGVDRISQWKEIRQCWQHAVALPAPELMCDDIDVIDPRLWRPN